MAVRVRDDMNRDVVLLRPPRRIVSLVPSDTETLFALGVGDRVVGRTRYCVEPAAGVADVPVCGGTKDIDVAAVAALEPELILCNQEENSRPALERLARSGYPVFVSFPRRVAEAIGHVARLARVLGVAGDPAVRDLIRRGHALLGASPGTPGPSGASPGPSGASPGPSGASSGESSGAPAGGPRVFVPIWLDPLMTLSGDTYGSDLLVWCGARNAFADRVRRYPLAADLGLRSNHDAPASRSALLPSGASGRDRDTRYPRITPGEVVERAPDLVLLPDEPFAFGAGHIAEFAALDTPAGRRGAVHLVSGKDLFWYGARTIEAAPRLRDLIADATSSSPSSPSSPG